MSDAIPRTTSVAPGTDRAEEALFGTGEELLWLLRKFPVDFGFGWLVRRENHARTMFGAWACRRRGDFGVLRHLLPTPVRSREADLDMDPYWV
ncbi:hypothetical protein Taro_044169 [Colocasia esculenta]|uniref:Uncharacterized protein n=1 Tax=Colocasia esculenta TaxID=4460 RepID=A0A843WL66_COLES|nr:hypothetical protein [Colocasia esculenta]